VSWRKRYLRPTSFARRIHEVDVEALRRDGVRGIIMDLDNTLVGYRLAAPDAEVAEWIAQAIRSGLQVVIVTNNTTAWARQTAQDLNVPCIANARKPLLRGFAAGLQALGTSSEETVVIGDQLFTDVLGAKRFGMKVILTEPIVAREQWWMRLTRFLERLVLYRVPRA
jgi:HAD superfamily phosphatase (TIGR01668 family)